MLITGKCSEYLPPSRMSLHLSDSDGMFDGDETYRLVDLGNGRTRLEVVSHYRLTEWFANLMEPLVTSAAEKKMVADVARLKSLVESSKRASQLLPDTPHGLPSGRP
jgi:hypothetical protein